MDGRFQVDRSRFDFPRRRRVLSSLRHLWAGWVATGFAVLITSLWTFWGTTELFFEGWGLPYPQPLYYLAPGLGCLFLSLLAVTSPLLGGWVMVLTGFGFTAWWWGLLAKGSALTLLGALGTIPVSLQLVLAGILFLIEARHRSLRDREPEPLALPGEWWWRNLNYLAVLGLPLLVALVVSGANLPIVLTRIDDGERGARLIEGNGVRLVWAPAGPGWSRTGPFADRDLSWNDLAFYGVEPAGLEEKTSPGGRNAASADMESTGLCRYLSADGLRLMPEPQNVWRMPTTDEVARSLVRHGENAGCSWFRNAAAADCRETPDKETPLWAPDLSPVYYWTADEFREWAAWTISYNGQTVQFQSKTSTTPRYGYRCVLEASAGEEYPARP